MIHAVEEQIFFRMKLYGEAKPEDDFQIANSVVAGYESKYFAPLPIFKDRT
jgi:hypothetical protein